MSTSKARSPWWRLISVSSSVIADAIQIASRLRSRPVSAVTSPPPPRRGTSSPVSSRSNMAGPRLDSRISRCCPGSPGMSARRSGAGGGPDHLTEVVEDLQPVAQQARHQEVRAHVLFARAPEPLAELRVVEHLDARGRRLVGGVD